MACARLFLFKALVLASAVDFCKEEELEGDECAARLASLKTWHEARRQRRADWQKMSSTQHRRFEKHTMNMMRSAASLDDDPGALGHVVKDGSEGYTAGNEVRKGNTTRLIRTAARSKYLFAHSALDLGFGDRIRWYYDLLVVSLAYNNTSNSNRLLVLPPFHFSRPDFMGVASFDPERVLYQIACEENLGQNCGCNANKAGRHLSCKKEVWDTFGKQMVQRAVAAVNAARDRAREQDYSREENKLKDRRPQVVEVEDMFDSETLRRVGCVSHREWRDGLRQEQDAGANTEDVDWRSELPTVDLLLVPWRRHQSAGCVNPWAKLCHFHRIPDQPSLPHSLPSSFTALRHNYPVFLDSIMCLPSAAGTSAQGSSGRSGRSGSLCNAGGACAHAHERGTSTSPTAPPPPPPPLPQHNSPPPTDPPGLLPLLSDGTSPGGHALRSVVALLRFLMRQWRVWHELSAPAALYGTLHNTLCPGAPSTPTSVAGSAAPARAEVRTLGVEAWCPSASLLTVAELRQGGSGACQFSEASRVDAAGGAALTFTKLECNALRSSDSAHAAQLVALVNKTVHDELNPIEIRSLFWNTRSSFRFSARLQRDADGWLQSHLPMLSQQKVSLEETKAEHHRPYVALHWRHGDMAFMGVHSARPAGWADYIRRHRPQKIVSALNEALNEMFAAMNQRQRERLKSVNDLYLLTDNPFGPELRHFAQLAQDMLGLKVHMNNVLFRGVDSAPATSTDWVHSTCLDMILASRADFFVVTHTPSFFSRFIVEERAMAGKSQLTAGAAILGTHKHNRAKIKWRVEGDMNLD